MRAHRAAIKVVCAAILVVAAGSCASRRDTPASSSPEFGTGTVIIDTDEGPVLLTVEVADTPERRAAGLMGRRELRDDYGMVFLFFEDTSAPFWMKDTLVPLSIAFFGVDGEITKIVDMDPCRADPCPLYEPGVAYRGALEVRQGSFPRWGVEPGDVVRLTQ